MKQSNFSKWNSVKEVFFSTLRSFLLFEIHAARLNRLTTQLYLKNVSIQVGVIIKDLIHPLFVVLDSVSIVQGQSQNRNLKGSHITALLDRWLTTELNMSPGISVVCNFVFTNLSRQFRRKYRLYLHAPEHWARLPLFFQQIIQLCPRYSEAHQIKVFNRDKRSLWQPHQEPSRYLDFLCLLNFIALSFKLLCPATNLKLSWYGMTFKKLLIIFIAVIARNHYIFLFMHRIMKSIVRFI